MRRARRTRHHRWRCDTVIAQTARPCPAGAAATSAICLASGRTRTTAAATATSGPVAVAHGAAERAREGPIGGRHACVCSISRGGGPDGVERADADVPDVAARAALARQPPRRRRWCRHCMNLWSRHVPVHIASGWKCCRVSAAQLGVLELVVLQVVSPPCRRHGSVAAAIAPLAGPTSLSMCSASTNHVLSARCGPRWLRTPARVVLGSTPVSSPRRCAVATRAVKTVLRSLITRDGNETPQVALRLGVEAGAAASSLPAAACMPLTFRCASDNDSAVAVRLSASESSSNASFIQCVCLCGCVPVSVNVPMQQAPCAHASGLTPSPMSESVSCSEHDRYAVTIAAAAATTPAACVWSTGAVPRVAQGPQRCGCGLTTGRRH